MDNKVILYTEGEPEIKVKFGLGFTLNLMNYESARIDAAVELTGTVGNSEALWNAAREEVEKELDKQLADLKTGIPGDGRTTMLGFKAR